MPWGRCWFGGRSTQNKHTDQPRKTQDGLAEKMKSDQLFKSVRNKPDAKLEGGRGNTQARNGG